MPLAHPAGGVTEIINSFSLLGGEREFNLGVGKYLKMERQNRMMPVVSRTQQTLHYCRISPKLERHQIRLNVESQQEGTKSSTCGG